MPITHSSIHEVAHWRTHAPVDCIKDAKGLKTFTSLNDRIHAWLPAKRDATFKRRYVIFGEPGHVVTIYPGERVRLIFQGDATTSSVIRVTG